MLYPLKSGRIVVTSLLPNGAQGACMEDGKLMTVQEWEEFKAILRRTLLPNGFKEVTP